MSKHRPDHEPRSASEPLPAISSEQIEAVALLGAIRRSWLGHDAKKVRPARRSFMLAKDESGLTRRVNDYFALNANA